jgi:nucleoside-diphosphate-sugar epimerase
LMISADVVIHLAAYKIPRYGNALMTLQVNTLGTKLVLNLADRLKAKFVFASTSDVFGRNPILPFEETSDLYFGAPAVKRWAYAISKLYGEHLCLARSVEKGTSVTILRYFGGYGPHQNLSWWGGPQSVFINQILENKSLTIHGDGLQTRTFTYIDDIVEGTIKAINNPSANNEIFNIGLGIPVSIIELAQIIWNLMRPQLPLDVTHIPYTTFGRYEDVRRRVPDTSKAEVLLGFKATKTLDDGLPITIDWQTAVKKKRSANEE